MESPNLCELLFHGCFLSHFIFLIIVSTVDLQTIKLHCPACKSVLCENTPNQPNNINFELMVRDEGTHLHIEDANLVPMTLSNFNSHTSRSLVESKIQSK